MKIKRGERSNTFCGPAALSLITGKHVDKCVEEIHTHRNDHYGFRRRSVRGVSRYEMLQVLARLGWDAKMLPVGYKGAVALDLRNSPIALVGRTGPTLGRFNRWLRNQGRNPETVYLINVTEHWMVMRGIKIFDNAHPEGVFFGKYSKRRRRVQLAWEITRRSSCPVPAVPCR